MIAFLLYWAALDLLLVVAWARMDHGR